MSIACSPPISIGTGLTSCTWQRPIPDRIPTSRRIMEGLVVFAVTGSCHSHGMMKMESNVVDNLLMRLSEVMMSVPALYLILALRAAFPTDIRSDLLYLMIILILSLVLWASLARIIRGMVLSIRENEYVTAAEAMGMPAYRVIIRHILPNTASFVIVAATLSVPGYILGEVALSFLGAGIQEPVASWGNMLQQAQSIRVLKSFPWILVPGVFIFLTVLAFNFLGDGLRDALDPKKVEGKA